MNKLVNLLFTICTCLIVVSCSKETTINITVEKKQNLSLYMFDKGDINVLQSFEMNPETNAGKVVVQLPYEGLYLIGQNEYASFPVYLRHLPQISAGIFRCRMAGFLESHSGGDSGLCGLLGRIQGNGLGHVLPAARVFQRQ